MCLERKETGGCHQWIRPFFPKNLIKALNSGSSSWKEMDYLLVPFEIMSDWME